MLSSAQRTDKEKICPLMRKPCIEGNCMFWVHMFGNDPQTGATVDHWNCSFAWIPILLVETRKAASDTAAAVESHRNEAVKASRGIMEAMAMANALPALLNQQSEQDNNGSGRLIDEDRNG